MPNDIVRITLPALPDNAQWRNRFEIPSSDGSRLYTVAQRKSSGEWACSCPGWIRHRHCKHLDALMPHLRVLGTGRTASGGAKRIDGGRR